MITIHPMLVHLPIGVLLASTLFALLARRWADAGYAQAALLCLQLGLLAVVPAVVSGVYDAWRQLTGPEIARTDVRILVSNLHAIATLAATGCYLRAWLEQRRRAQRLVEQPGWLAAGALLLVAGGWLGGYLVYRLGMGQY